jgi:hypothetical protein
MELYGAYISDLSRINEFCEAAMLNSHRSAWKKRRKEGYEYGYVLIANEGYKFGNGMSTWWAPFIGIQVFARLDFVVRHGIKVLRDVFPVRLNNTLIHEGRCISPQSIILL